MALIILSQMIFFGFCAGFIGGKDLRRFRVGSSKLICKASLLS